MLQYSYFDESSFAANKNGMSRRTKIITAIFFIPGIAVNVKAQDTARLLTIDDAIAATLSNSKAVQLAKMDEDIAATTYKQTTAIWLPQVGFSYTAISTNNPLNAFGVKLQQKLITPKDFDPALLNHPSGTGDFTTQLQVQQPLINMDLWYQRQAAAKQTELYQYKTQRTKEYLAFEVQKAYLQLQLAYDAVAVVETSLQTTRAVYTFTDNRYQQGLLQKSDLLNTQVQITMAETNLAKAKNNILTASDHISLLMGQPMGVVYKTTGTPLLFTTGSTTSITANRSDFLAMQKAIEATGLVIKANRMSYLPKLNAFGTYQLNDNRMLGFGANAYMAGVQLSWSIFKGNTTRNAITVQTLQQKKLEKELTQLKEEQQLELNRSYRDLSNADFEIKQQQAAIEQATEAFTILQNRYQQGLVNTTDVLMAATQLSQQKFALAQARFMANTTKAYLQFLTATNK